jgi:hypothetical protein
MASSTELAERAGLGRQFFSTVAREHRSPKLTNFLKALTAIHDVANDHLRDVERGATGRASQNTNESDVRILQNHQELFLLATSLAQMARDEIEKLDNERPNDPATIAAYTKQRELLVIFADGFDRIASALASLSSNPAEPVLLGKARDIVNSVGTQINAWWNSNAAEATDWGVRIPVITAGVAMLGWAGADMMIATTAVAAIVGGGKVIKAIGKVMKKS